MNCQGTQEMIDAYRDGELNAAQNFELARHLEKCPACARMDGERRALAEAIALRARRFTAPLTLQQKLRS